MWLCPTKQVVGFQDESGVTHTYTPYNPFTSASSTGLILYDTVQQLTSNIAMVTAVALSLALGTACALLGAKFFASVVRDLVRRRLYREVLVARFEEVDRVVRGAEILDYAKRKERAEARGRSSQSQLSVGLPHPFRIVEVLSVILEESYTNSLEQFMIKEYLPQNAERRQITFNAFWDRYERFCTLNYLEPIELSLRGGVADTQKLLESVDIKMELRSDSTTNIFRYLKLKSDIAREKAGGMVGGGGYATDLEEVGPDMKEEESESEDEDDEEDVPQKNESSLQFFVRTKCVISPHPSDYTFVGMFFGGDSVHVENRFCCFTNGFSV
jgi:hypothetical protein